MQAPAGQLVDQRQFFSHQHRPGPPFASLSISRRPLAPTAGADRTSPPPVAATAAAPYTCDDVLALVLVSLLLAVFEKLSRVL